MSDLRRFFVEKANETLVVDGEEFRHAVSVLRIKENEEIIVCDNSGTEYLATVIKINKKDFLCKLHGQRQNQAEPKTEVTLVSGYLTGDKTELVVQKAVELGVKKIVVFSSEFSSAYMNENKLARLNRVSVESAKQCGRSIYPKVNYLPFEDAIKYAKDYKNKLFACEFASENEVDFSSLSGNTAIVVGSEGGFSEEEFYFSIKNGFSTVSSKS